jgi:hypothetical protein
LFLAGALLLAGCSGGTSQTDAGGDAVDDAGIDAGDPGTDGAADGDGGLDAGDDAGIDAGDPGTDGAADGDGGIDAGGDDAGADGVDGTDIDPGPPYDPWTVIPSSDLSSPRGWVTVRGIIHCHSPYSHDACDDNPFPNGVRNEECFEQCRDGMCLTLQDFVFMTDHDDLFAQYEYPDVLLYKAGDTLIERGGLPVANRIACADGHEVILAAGTESGMMPIGLEQHMGATVAEREAAYNDESEAGIRALQAAGALVFLQHTEDWDVQIILDRPIDGIECYNLHFNLTDNMALAAWLLLQLVTNPDDIGAVELALLALFKENDAALFSWSKAVMQKPMPAFLATDAHQNVFPVPSPDGERLDSFRRVMHWFSNYVLVPAGPLDDAVLKEAIGRGRMYGVFDYLGYPDGFDFYAQGNQIYEMGDHVPAGESVELVVTLPVVHRVDPDGPQPVISGLILKANDGDWDEVASGNTDLTYSAGPGAYRAEIRIVPEHLRPWLGSATEVYVRDTVWIYSNPIYIGMPY